MTTTMNRIAAGIYHIYDENGYQIAAIHKTNRHTRPWIITSPGGTPAGATATLKEAVQIFIDRREE